MIARPRPVWVGCSVCLFSICGSFDMSALVQHQVLQQREGRIMAHHTQKTRDADQTEVPAQIEATASETGAGQQIFDAWNAWVFVGVFGTFMLAAISSIFFREGVLPFIGALVYVSALIVTRLFVKDALMSGFPHPYMITVFHMLVTTAVAAMLDPPQIDEAVVVLPVALLSGATLVLGNTALLYGTVAFVSMIGSCTPATNFAIKAVHNRAATVWCILAVTVVCIGGALCIYGEEKFSSTALAMSVGTCLCLGIKAAWQRPLLQASISPTRMAAWSGLWSLPLLLPIAVHFEGIAAFHACTNMEFIVAKPLVASTVMAAALSIAQRHAIKCMGPLQQTVVSTLQLVMVLVLSTAWLHESVTALQWGGVLFIAVSCAVIPVTEAVHAATQDVMKSALNCIPGPTSGVKSDS